jgi:hypothetical protein
MARDRDSEILAGILRRGRIRNQNEYYLVRSAIDYQEGLIARDEEALQILYALADKANIQDLT